MSADIAKGLTALLKDGAGAPFLFVGSGFSRRYIGLETWQSLLDRFCVELKNFGYYTSSSNGSMPKCASLIARDFNEVWWSSDDYGDSRAKVSHQPNDFSFALKYEISEYLSGKSLKYKEDDSYAKELEFLAQMNVDGIITTNWDLLLEQLFPDYKSFVGQEELIFSNPQSIAEIYKIHGCASRPASLVLTEEDYEDFRERNPYLAAKLITIFVEHPVVFIGYSINDPHIQSIIESIASCLGADKIRQFEQNLIFVERASGQEEAFEGATLALGANKIRVTLVRTDDFLKVYEAIDTVKRKIPARVLRYCKEQMYDLVKSANPENRLAVLDLDEIGDKNDVEFIVGVGVAKAKKEADAAVVSIDGYRGVSINDLFADALRSQSAFNSDDLLKFACPEFKKLSNKYIPIFRFLHEVGIRRLKDLKNEEYKSAGEIAERMLRLGFRAKSYRAHYDRHYHGLSTADIIAKTTAEKATLIIPFQDPKSIDLDVLLDFLNQNIAKVSEGQYKTYFRKLVCLYDYLRFGPK